MNGLVFQSFVAVVEDRHGLEIADSVLDQPGLVSGGVYMRDCDYDEREFMALVNALGVETDQDTSALLHELGGQLFECLIEHFPELPADAGSGAELLRAIAPETRSPQAERILDARLLDYAWELDEQGEVCICTQAAPPLREVVIGFVSACMGYFDQCLTLCSADPQTQTTRMQIARPGRMVN